ncbi:MAG: hypothetical protein QFX35_00960 [Candidatus Verstraetearchaeota archaeon]|nr:hypothetical protein [Candidatus Verstraetearchaeota archaeon]
MGGRKRKKVVRRMKRSIPKIFSCPNCGEKTLAVEINREMGIAEIKCGKCKINYSLEISSVEHAVDAYGKFIDKYYSEEKEDRNEEG